MKFLKLIFSVFLGAFIGALIEGLKGAPKMITASIFGGLAFVIGSIIITLWLSRQLWPERDDWWATSSYQFDNSESEQKALLRDRRQQWRSPKPQELEAWFDIDLGKLRMIAHIFLDPINDEEKPSKWCMQFYGQDNQILKHKDGVNFIFVEGADIPHRIESFRVQIKEVAEDVNEGTNYAKRYGIKPYWSISFIRMEEYRFSIFGKRFWRHEL